MRIENYTMGLREQYVCTLIRKATSEQLKLEYVDYNLGKLFICFACICGLYLNKKSFVATHGTKTSLKTSLISF